MGRFLQEIIGANKIIKKWTSRLGITKYRFGIAAAVFSLAVISGNQYIMANTNQIYLTFFGDEQIGAVSDPKIVQEWLDQKAQELKQQYPNAQMALNSGPIRFEQQRQFRGTYDNNSVLAALDRKVDVNAVGVELKVDGKVLGVVKDQQTADNLLNEIKQKYIPKTKEGEVQILSADSQEDGITSGKAELVSVDFVQNVNLSSVETTPDQITEPQELLRKLVSGDVQPAKYKVQSGDCISCIAKKFNIPQEVIYKNNPWITDDFIKIGDELDLTVLQPMLSVKTVEKRNDTVTVPNGKIYEKDNTMRAGTSKVIVEGKPGKKEVTYQITKVNGQLVEQTPVNEAMVEDPMTTVVRQGTKVIPGTGTGTFAWPVIAAQITSEFGNRWGKFHAGTDNVSSNRSIMAADNGKVILAEYSPSYGYYIIIDHQNGYKTLYAHMSKLNVNRGQTVAKGDKIGIMGNTGNSTGVHLHFEIRKGDKQENPLKYLNR